MNAPQRDVLSGYLRNADIDIQSISFLAAKSSSPSMSTVLNSVKVQYYERKKDGWFLTTDTVLPSGEVETSSIKAVR
jgi:hypothetical protein